MLTKVFKRAVKAGGVRMPRTDYPRIFGNDPALRKNVLRICGNDTFAQAVSGGVVCDHRVIETLVQFGPTASRIVLELEAKLGRKLTRSRVQQLARVYLRSPSAANVVPFRRVA